MLPMPSAPHVLLAAPRMIYPPASGGDLRVYSLLRGVSGRYRFSLLTFFDPEERARTLAAALTLERNLGIRVHLVPREQSGSSAAWMPPEFDYFRSEQAAARLRELLSQDSVDLLHLEFSEMAQYARAARGLAPVLLTEHDTSLLARRGCYMDRAGTGTSTAWRRRRLYLRRCLADCDRVVVVSEADRRRLQAFFPGGRVDVVGTGVDLERFPARGPRGRKAGSLVFVGHFPHYPNEDAAVWLVKDILPLIRRRVPAARLRLVGSGPTPAVRGLASSSVEVTGPVAEVHPHLASARVFVAPLRMGFGIKGKVLEAFASGTPVVATPEACEGIPEAKGGEHFLVGDGPSRFADQVCRLLRDPALGAKLASNARELVERSYSWRLQADRLDRVYRSVIQRRAPAVMELPAGRGA